jgi:hypothetical protein
MSEWWTYRLSDLILFSPDTYYRTFALYHQRIWPAHLVVLAVLLLWAATMRRTVSPANRGRVAMLILASWWLWTGFQFHLASYATINWAARYLAAAFGVEACILLWHAARGRLELGFDTARIALVALLVIAGMAPVAGLATGRGWDQVEVIGLTPDPTAVATIAVLVLTGPRAPRLALVIPVLSCLVGVLTLYALDSAEAWWALASTLGALCIPRLPVTGAGGARVGRPQPR